MRRTALVHAHSFAVSSLGTDVSDALPVFEYLNTLAGEHGVGRVDVVENRFVGIKSRGFVAACMAATVLLLSRFTDARLVFCAGLCSVYECPAGTVLRTAHVGLEGLCLDREVYRLRDMMSAKFADYCYNGFWFSPEMEFVLHAVEKSQEVCLLCRVATPWCFCFVGRAVVLLCLCHCHWLCDARGGKWVCDTTCATYVERDCFVFLVVLIIFLSFSLVCLFLLLVACQQRVTGYVDVELFKGSATIKARSSPQSLYSAVRRVAREYRHKASSQSVCLKLQGIASMDDIGEYDPTAAAGFIDICAHRLRAHTNREKNQE